MISINGDPIRYMLDFENDLLFLNQFIGKNINLKKKGYFFVFIVGSGGQELDLWRFCRRVMNSVDIKTRDSPPITSLQNLSLAFIDK